MIGLRSLSASGGIETMARQIAPRLVSMGWPVTVFCRGRYNPSKEQWFGDSGRRVRLTNVPTIYTKHLETITYTFLALIHALFQPCRIVHIHALGPALLSFIPRFFGKKVIVTIHGLDYKRAKWGGLAKVALRIAETLAVKVPHRTVVVSRTLQTYLEMKYPKRIDFIPNGVDHATPAPLDGLKRFEVRSRGYVLFLSRIVPEKGLDLLIEAFRELETDLRLLIVGDAHYDRAYGEALRETAKGDSRILFTGPLFGEEKEEALSNAFLFVLPSYIEGMSIVLLEAMSHGQCPVVSDISENLEVIGSPGSDESVGVSFKSGDASDLRRILKDLIANPARVQEIGEKAREKARREFNWDRIANQYAELYESMIQ